ncbi:hypothetical protein [Chelativorans xinjiangense]|uniref:hypothetical protein n=1 Tax=Chelativorans xinjiangense TaxID=2681485 RepID=UPI00135CE4F3|nr:hypothetical protein [Chelativorans xinjiangense]
MSDSKRWDRIIASDYRHSAMEYREFEDEVIARMTPEEAFAEFCEWHGLIGWARTLMAVHDSARAHLPIAPPSSEGVR